jgi:acyl-CoA synthetase (AMP-forming)/AMP-acid ligase II
MSELSEPLNTATAGPVIATAYETFADMFRTAATAFPKQEAYVHGTARITFEDWLVRAEGLARALRERGVAPGDVVLIALEPSIEFAVSYAAVQLAGAVGSGVNTRLGRREIVEIIARSRPSLMILEDAAEAISTAPPLIRRSELGALCRPPGLSAAERPRRKSSDPAVIVWTSGTTGLPKGAWFDHDNLRSAVAVAGPMSAPFERRLSSTPFAHAGYMTKVWEQLAFGLTLVISGQPWTAAEMLRLIIDERINVAGGVPTQWAKLLDLPDLARADFSHLRLGIAATAPAPPELVERVTRTLTCPLIVRYAMTECPAISGTRPGDRPDVLYKTVGRPQPGLELIIADDDGAPVPEGAVGRLRIRSPSVMRGYWNDEDSTARALSSDGWLISGDYGRLDPEGNIVLAGRASEMYIRGGYNVYPIEVERVLSELAGVAAVAVVGKAAPVIGEIGVAFVVPTDPDNPPTIEALRAWSRSQLADYKAPDELVLVPALPLTPMMKVDKAALAARLLAG